MNEIYGTDSTITMSSIVGGNQAMVDFARKWYALGGGNAADITDRFGCSTDEYFGQLQALLLAAPPTEISPRAVAAMLQVCRRRLWLHR